MFDGAVYDDKSSKLDNHIAIEAAASVARDWMFGDAFPLWSQCGRTSAGLFAERISLDGVPDDAYFRSFVQARHIYSFAEGGTLGWKGPWERLISETIERLLNSARRADGLFVHKLSANGEVLDDRADLYDQAFMLFALGKAGQALSQPLYFDEAERFASQLANAWALPGDGYFEGEIVDSSIRRQNPHMHLFEAFLCLFDGSRRQVFLDAAIKIAELCDSRFIDPSTGALLEYFETDWTPSKGNLAGIVEPGHCFEWAWLFERLADLGWQKGKGLADGLVQAGRANGICQFRGVAINEIHLDGSILNNDARLWPQTERLKAAVARYKRLGTAKEAEEIVAAADGLSKYLSVGMQGLWRDKLRPDGSWIEELVPGSSLYHIVCAYAELIRV